VQAEFLNYLRVREWQDFESQLRQVCKEMSRLAGRRAASPDHRRGARVRRRRDGIHQALLSGLLSHIGLLEEREKDKPRAAREYLGARGPRSRSSPAAGCTGRTRSS
jgi:ATP-dependent helicase HrpA